MRPYRVKKMWNGMGWTYYKRWENFTRREREHHIEECRKNVAPELRDTYEFTEPHPKQIMGTTVPQFRAGDGRHGSLSGYTFRSSPRSRARG